MKKGKPTTGKMILPAAIAVLCIFCAGCSRYAPSPIPQQKQRIMEIEARTAAPLSDSFYYYFAFDTSGPQSQDGPRAYLSGPERGKNWSYYIRLKSGVFTEKVVSAASSIDDEPETFNTLSPRFYQASAIGNMINIKIYLDRIITPPAAMSMNIITSELPLTPTTADIPAIDYFIQPKVTLGTTTGSYADNSLNPLSTSHTVADDQQKAADVVSWTYEIYER